MQATESNPAEQGQHVSDEALEAEDRASDAEARIAELEAALLAVRDEQLRERADLDNQRKRMARELDQARRFANERLLSELLPVMDNLERGLEAGGTDFERLREGVELTLRQLQKVAEDHGLVPVPGAGAPFNPDHHQAVSVAESSDHPADTVVSAMQKGYLLNGRLLRPALVVVAK
ncbi:nucleotide exchange factor GrpE [Pseudomarimonas salicorniae]|uniref:Protein GrpE n=1 Tax=Pseudomarimonas salicorniae TaxID=2933270 RepID=A0ABT0GFH9_9GAMM|nr:nucleotide exchange factor GrpE [Lysobacter sp. CAU 1642]MCK7593117.1 nucleotide exchange factor GrpE [Lysobacter sp. CAU 1642]